MPKELTKEVKLVFRGGKMVAVYDDNLLPLLEELGKTTITRASHVEPCEGGKWDADMRPSGGPASLGPFDTRTQALEEEVRWLKENVITTN